MKISFPTFSRLLIILWVPMFTETQESKKEDKDKSSSKNSESDKEKNLLTRLKKTRIVLKDNSVIKNCRIKAMDYVKIVYEQSGNLYDQMIGMIERIDILDGTMHAIFFDEKNEPSVGAYVY